MPSRTVKLLIVIVLLTVIGGGIYILTGLTKANSINSFDECAAAGNPVMESYPERCSANGRVFVNN